MMVWLILGLMAYREELCSISELQWKARVVLCKSDVALFDTLLPATTSETEGINERDVIYFFISGELLVSNYNGTLSDLLRREIHAQFKEESEAVILIGKDGGVKGVYSSLRWAKIFAAIDAMPMREREKRKK